MDGNRYAGKLLFNLEMDHLPFLGRMTDVICSVGIPLEDHFYLRRRFRFFGSCEFIFFVITLKLPNGLNEAALGLQDMSK